MANEQQLKDITERTFELINAGDIDSLNEVYTDDFTYRTTSGIEAHGLDEFKQLWSVYNDAFSDLEFVLEEIFIEGNRGVSLYRMTGKQTGDFQGIEASNNDVDVLFCSIGTFDDDGNIVDVYDVSDTFDLLRQLDALPSDVSDFGDVTGTRTGA